MGQLPNGLWEIQKDIRVTFDELSSLYQTQRGGMPYETSGKAIVALQQAGDTALVQLQMSVEDAITDWGRKRLSNIQQFYTFDRQWRISNNMKEQSHYLITQRQKRKDPLTGEQMNDEPSTVHMYKLEDGNPEPTLLTEDFGVPSFDLKFTMGTGHLRSREQKLKEAQFLYEAQAVDDVYLLQEFEVEGRSEIAKRMEEKNQVMQLGQQVGEMMQDPEIGSLVSMLIENPGQLVQSLQAAGLDPQTIGQPGVEQPQDNFDPMTGPVAPPSAPPGAPPGGPPMMNGNGVPQPQGA
jgi:hypothetical protein